MKSKCALLLVILMAIIAVTPAIYVSAAGNDNVYLFNPSSACTFNDFLFIADNVDEYNSKIHIFDYRTDNVVRYTIDFSFQIYKIRCTGNLLFILRDDDAQPNNLLEIYEYNNFDVDKLVITYTDITDFDANIETYIISTSERVQSYNTYTHTRIVNRNLKAQGITLSDDNSIFYIINNALNKLDRTGNDAEFKAITVSKGSKICSNSVNYYLYNDIDVNDEKQIINIFISNYRAYVTNTTAQSVSRHPFKSGVIDMQTVEISIGDSGLDLQIPYEIGTLYAPDFLRIARGINKDSTIIYTPSTIEDNNYKLSGTLTPSKQAIVMGEVSIYYLIFFDGKFGFIEKNQVEFLDSIRLSSSPVVKYFRYSKTTIYCLPYINNSMDRAESKLIYDKYQTANLTNATNTVVNVYASFYYDRNYISLISYVDDGGKTVTGYVLTGDLKDNIFANNDREYQLKKANPEILSVLPIYSNSDGTNRLDVTVKSGTTLRMYETRGGYSYIEFEYDYRTIGGWVQSSYLIDSGMTRNETVGLIISVSLLIFSVVILILIKRRKKHAKADDEVYGIEM